MAWLERKRNGVLVRWRDDHGRTRSRFFQDEDEAQAFKASVEVGPALPRAMQRAEARGEIVGYTPRGDDPHTVENFARSMVNGNRDLRDTTRALYLRTIRTHIRNDTRSRRRAHRPGRRRVAVVC